jgi:hypothetical protein
MPYSMTIVDYSIFFLGNVDVDLLVFLKNFLGNEGVNIVSHVMVFLILHTHFICLFFRENDILYPLYLVFDYSILEDITVIFDMYIL